MSSSLGHDDGHIRKRRRLDDIQDEENLEEGRQASTASIRLSRNDYQVGWICALPLELAAAKAMLDAEHYPLPNPANDNNNYHFGSICGHNVVITCLPSGIYGTNAAAVVATRMMSTFQSIKMPLMVGIGGGVPSPRHDIRLGDVVISTPSEYPAVVQYDIGKTGNNGIFKLRGTLNKPTAFLLRAVANLQANHHLGRNKVPIYIQEVMHKYSLDGYVYPGSEHDILYQPICDHAKEDSCTSACAESGPIQRDLRRNANPFIHYGTIGSGNQVIKHGPTRDRLAEEHDVLCFEMEAAGVMDEHQCLVIRGICDYCDSHKNDHFQHYSALAAAAVAKELLATITVREATARLDVSQATAKKSEHRRAIMEALDFEESDSRRENVKKAHAETCRWLLRQSEYLDWLDFDKYGEHHGLLWIKGKAGTGKSTIMKFVLEQIEKQKGSDLVIISFFFNARGHDLEKSTMGMYRSLLHQLLEQIPEMQELLDGLSPNLASGKVTRERLEMALKRAVLRLKSKHLICFVDALDECPEDQIRKMVEFFEDVGEHAFSKQIRFHLLFSSRHYPNISTRVGHCLTLENQDGHSQDLVNYIKTELKIGKTDGLDQINDEILKKSAGIFLWVVLVIRILNKEYDKGRVLNWSDRLKDIPLELDDLFRDILTRDNQRLSELVLCMQWVLYTERLLGREEFYCALLAGIQTDGDILPLDSGVVTRKVMDNLILDTSKGLVEITRSRKPKVSFIHESVREFLLKPGALSSLHNSFQEINEGKSHQRLRECCERQLGSITLSELGLPRNMDFWARKRVAAAFRDQLQKKFPFLEYSVQYFFHHANHAQRAGFSQSECLKALDQSLWITLFNAMQKHQKHRLELRDQNKAIIRFLTSQKLDDILVLHDNFLSPTKEARSNLATWLVEIGDLHRCKLVLEKYCQFPSSTEGRSHDHVDTLLTLAFTQKGMRLQSISIINALLDWDNQPLQNDLDRALYVAVQLRHEVAISLLCDKGANAKYLDAKKLPLLHTIIRPWDPKKLRMQPVTDSVDGILSCISVLIKYGAFVDTRSENGSTPLLYAARSGPDAVINLLLSHGADVHAVNDAKQNALHIAADEKSDLSVVKLLIEHKVDVRACDESGKTPLHKAAISSSFEVILELLANGADINAICSMQETPLHVAVRNRNAEAVTVFLGQKANPNAHDAKGRTPLHAATPFGSASLLEDLFEHGADANARDSHDRTPLHDATLRGSDSLAVEVLLKHGADANARDADGRTSLHEAIKSESINGFEVILNHGSDRSQRHLRAWVEYVRKRPGRPRTYFANHKKCGSIKLIQLLLAKGADVNALENNNNTPLHFACMWENLDAARALLAAEAQPNIRNQRGRTPLNELCFQELDQVKNRGIREKIVMLLMHSGASADEMDNDSRNPMYWAAVRGDKELAKLIYHHGADIIIPPRTSESEELWNETMSWLISLQDSERPLHCCDYNVNPKASGSALVRRSVTGRRGPQSVVPGSASMNSKIGPAKRSVIDLERSPSVKSGSMSMISGTKQGKPIVIDLERSPSVLSCSVSSLKVEQDNMSISNASFHSNASSSSNAPSNSNASSDSNASRVSESIDSVHLNDSMRNQGHSSSGDSILEWIKKV